MNDNVGKMEATDGLAQYRVDLSLPPDQIIRGLINFENNTDFNEQELTFDKTGAVPTTKAERIKYDRLDKVNTYYRGRVNANKIYYYNRIRLNEFLGNIGISVPWKKHQTTAELLPYVLIQLGINLSPADILDRYIDPEAYTIEIEIFRRNIAYVGTINVIFEGHPESLGGRVVKRDLAGFTKSSIE